MPNKFATAPLQEDTIEDEIVWKKYVLSDSIKSTAQIYVGDKDTDKAFRLDTPRRVGLYLKHTFADKNGKRRITRFKLGSTSIYQSEQISKDMIDANDKHTDEERRTLYLVNGVLVTNDEYVQAFLHEDNNPQREEFTGRDRGGVTPIIRELDEAAMDEEENDFIFKTAEALQKIKQMSKDEAAAYISLFYGASFTVPESLTKCQNLLSKSLENNEARIDMILKGDKNVDDEITVLLSKAINKGVLSFELKQNFVQVLRDGEWVDAKMISADSYGEREILFRQYLASPEGELLRKDIEGMVNQKDEAPKGKKKNLN